MNAKEYLESQGVFGLDTKKRYNEVIEWMEGYAQERVKNCSIPAVIKSLPDSDEIRMKARELDEKDFAQWMYELQKGNVL